MTIQEKASGTLGEAPETLLAVRRRERSRRPAISTSLSLSRVIITPFVVFLLLANWRHGTSLAALLFVVASVTDVFDGYFARRYGIASTLGVYFDLTADKLLVSAVLIAMVELAMVPAWIVIVIVSREFLIVGVRMFAAAEGLVMPAQGWGKSKTVTTLAAMAALIIRADQAKGGLFAAANGLGIIDAISFLAWPMMILATILTVVSGLLYLKQALPLIARAEARIGHNTPEVGRREDRPSLDR